MAGLTGIHHFARTLVRFTTDLAQFKLIYRSFR